MAGSRNEAPRPMRKVATSSMDASDSAQTRKMFDKRFLRRYHRDRYEEHLADWCSRHLPEQSELKSARVGDDATRVQVCVRKRPLFEREVQEEEFDVISVRGSEVVMHNCLTKPDLKTLFVHHSGFRFSEVFDESASDDDVYAQSAMPAVEHALEHGVATIFMFGQTGSGKTHTMDGLILRAAGHIFGDAGPLGRDVNISGFEIAGKNLRDLLAPPGSPLRPSIRSDERHQTAIVGLAEHEARSPDALLALVERAKASRATRATQANDTSSRSHAVYRITIVDGDSAATGTNVRASVLTLVDCAGTERREDSSHHDVQSRKDATEINSSLFALKECFRALRSPNGQPPYRDSFLTRVLSDSFSNHNARVVAVGTVSPSASDTEHSIATLRALQQLQGTQMSFEAREDLAAQKQASRGSPHPKLWTEDEVRSWLSTALGGDARTFAPALSKGTDGKNLMRWSAVRFAQLCAGDAGLGDRLYQDLRRRIQS